jgi:hypothetical protein
LVPSSVSSSSVSPLPPSASAVVPPLVRIPPIDYDQSEEGSSQTSTDSGNQTDLEQASTLGESSSIVIVLEEQQQQQQQQATTMPMQAEDQHQIEEGKIHVQFKPELLKKRIFPLLSFMLLKLAKLGILSIKWNLTKQWGNNL